MFIASRPLWPEFLKDVLRSLAVAAGVYGSWLLVQVGLSGLWGPIATLHDQLKPIEQLSLGLKAMAIVLPALSVYNVVKGVRLFRRLQRAGRAPHQAAVLLRSSGTLWAGATRVVGQLYLTRDELCFASQRPALRRHDKRVSLRSIERVSLCRVTVFRMLAVRIALNDGGELTLSLVAPKTWAAWLARQRAFAAAETAL